MAERGDIQDPSEEDYELSEFEDQEDLAEVPEAEDEEPGAGAGDEDDGEGASLDELLAQRAASARGADGGDDEPDIMSLASERHAPAGEPLAPVRVAPVREREEFVCRSCHLVKPRVQLADPQRGLCRDCA